MKKLTLLILLIVLSFQTISSQEQNERNLITSGKWHIEYVEMDGQKMDYSTEMQENNWIIFHRDGKYEGMFGNKRIGHWELGKEGKIIEINEQNQKSEQKLISVSKNELIISTEDEEGVVIILGMRK